VESRLSLALLVVIASTADARAVGGAVCEQQRRRLRGHPQPVYGAMKWRCVDSQYFVLLAGRNSIKRPKTGLVFRPPQHRSCEGRVRVSSVSGGWELSPIAKFSTPVHKPYSGCFFAIKMYKTLHF